MVIEVDGYLIICGRKEEFLFEGDKQPFLYRLNHGADSPLSAAELYEGRAMKEDGNCCSRKK